MQLHWDVAPLPILLTDTLVPRLVELGLLSSASDVHQAVLNIYHKVIPNRRQALYSSTSDLIILSLSW